MQWLIDIIMGMLDEAGYIKTSYQDRGSYATFDWGAGDLVLDGAWHELDCSGIVDAGAKAAVFRIKTKGTSLNDIVRLRPHGTTSNFYTEVIWSKVANVYDVQHCVIGLSTDLKVDYWIRNTVTGYSWVIRGWFF